jgi:predicted secreted protein
MSKINGDLMLMIVDGYTLAGQKNGSADFSADMLDATAKDSGGFKEYIAGWKGHTFSLENLYDPDVTTNTDFASVFAKWKAGTAVTLKWGEAVAGRNYYTAQALISKVTLTGPANQLSSYSLSLQGTGEVIEAVVGATSTLAEFLMYAPKDVESSTVIATGAGTVTVHIHTGTSKAALLTYFVLSPGATAKIGTTPQISGITTNDFTSAVVYVVTAQDGSTTKTWTVTVTADL